MTNFKVSLLAMLILAPTINGCSDDVSKTVIIEEPINPPSSFEPIENVFGKADISKTQPKGMTLSIARSITGQNPKWNHPVYDCSFNPAIGKFCNDGTPPAFMFSDVDVQDLYATTSHFTYDYILEDAFVNLSGKDWATTRPERFKPGWGSVFDLLLIAAEQYDLDIEYFYDEELDTYWITSINGVTEMDPSSLLKDSDVSVPFAQCSQGGGWKFAYAASPWPTPHGQEFHAEESYKQIDLMPIGNNAKAFLIPACKEEIDLRRNIYKKELARLAENEGKMIIPEIVIDWAWDRRVTYKNLEVKAYNQRPDIYQDGVISTMDIFLSLAEKYPEIDAHFAWWPKLSNDATVNGYILNSLSLDTKDTNGKVLQDSFGSSGTAGFVHNSGEWERYNDSGLTAVMYKNLMCNPEHTGSNLTLMPKTDCTGGTWRQTLPDGQGWKSQHWGTKTPITPFGSKNGENKTYFSDAFGGNDIHMTMDLFPQVSPEYVNLYRTSFTMSDEWSSKLISEGKDVYGHKLTSPLPPELDYSPFDIKDAPKPLTEDHFGWKQSNCKTCHSTTLGSGHIVGEMKPFECAQCHGSNGAPQGHGETVTCGFCHAKTLTLHGDAYTGNISEEGWNENLNKYISLGLDAHPARYYGLYTDYPETASCLTCHPNN